MTELLPCPHCGGDAEYVYRDVPFSRWRHAVVCASSTCGAEGPPEGGKTDAIRAWNRRAPSPPREPVRVTNEMVEACKAAQDYIDYITGQHKGFTREVIIDYSGLRRLQDALAAHAGKAPYGFRWTPPDGGEGGGE